MRGVQQKIGVFVRRENKLAGAEKKRIRTRVLALRYGKLDCA